MSFKFKYYLYFNLSQHYILSFMYDTYKKDMKYYTVDYNELSPGDKILS